ncbi:MAG: PD40 domain-containing protein [Myxococcales bacterium]|nr:PD40 domain-containing protein [Myxococcales bacterium]
MTDVELGSRSDLEALSRSGRGKVITLVVLLAVALGAAGWYFFLRKHGTGNPEDPAKVIFVGRTRGFSMVLDDVGFEAAEGTLEAWEQKAKEEVPDLEVTGVEAIMALADRFGYGYVIFEQPQEIDFSVLDIEEVPELPEHVRYAVLSAGDLAFPHVMTVNPKPSEVLSGSSVVVLQALFAQEKLAELLPDAESPSIESIQLRDRLRDAVDRLAQVPEAEKMAEKIVQGVRHQLEEEERAEPRPSLVGDALESGEPFPLANGQVLTVSRGFKVVTRDAVRADLDVDDRHRLWVGAPGAEPSSRKPCDALFSGEISVHESPRFHMAPDGAALLTQTLGQGMVLWTLGEGPGACPFVERGSVASPRPGLGEPVPAGHGQVAWAGIFGSQGVVHVVTAGSDDDAVTLGMIDGVELTSVAWLSERHLAAIGQGMGGSWLYLMDTQTPMTVLRLPATAFENAEGLQEVAAGKRGDQPVVVVTAGIMPRKAYRLVLPMGLEAMFASPPAAEASPEPPVDELGFGGGPDVSREERGLPAIVDLDPNRFEVTVLTHEGSARGPSVSADGRWAAVAMRGELYDPTDPDDSEIVVVSTDGGSPQVLTRNALKDHQPRLTPDGSHVVFQTRVEIPRTDWVVTSARVAKVGS